MHWKVGTMNWPLCVEVEAQNGDIEVEEGRRV